LANLWGSEPAAWADELAGWGRLRVIVNAMTRLRFFSPDGVMEFMTKGEVHQPPEGCLPWFAVPGRRSADVTIACGHWSALGLRVEPGLIALDTGCLWGRELSGVWLDTREVVQVPCQA
jgi:bis(5'-nucleosyl)-tetraphosphatase (symmetrical)